MNWKMRGRGDGRRPLVIAAALTPFRDGRIDFSSFEENLRFGDAMGLDGFLVAGTTGEPGRYETDERDSLLRTARSCLSEELILISGVKPTDLSPEAVIADLRRIHAAGGNVALVTPPIDPATDQRDEAFAASWLAAIVNAGILPVLAYHAPTFRTYPWTDQTLRDVSQVPGLAGVKDSVGDRRIIDHWLRRRSDHFGVFVGSARLFPETGRDVAGGILALAGAFPEEYAAMAQALGSSSGDVTTWAELLEGPLKRFETGKIPALRELYEERGLFGGE